MTQPVPQLSGHTTPFAVLGHPIGHTLSPVMHNAAIRSLAKDAIYLAFDVAPTRLMDVLPAMHAMGFGGVNLTVPLKEVAFRGLTDLDDSARRLGAVNTIEFAGNGMRGHNTDGRGFLEAVREAFGIGIDGRPVFVLGCGGAGRAVAITCAAQGAQRIALADVDAARVGNVTSEIAAIAPDVPVDSVEAGDANALALAVANADVVIQATPVGMRSDDPPLLEAAAFRAGQHVFDMIYMYPETPFMAAGREAGAAAANGLGMLLHQGAAAFEIWTGTSPPVDVMREALEREVYGEDATHG